MNNRPLLPVTLLSVALITNCDCPLSAQDTRAFNQNASRSNHTTRSFNQNASRSNHTRLGLSFSPTYSTPLKSNTDSLLFRGSGAGFRVGADYYMGKVAIGFSAGFSSSSPDKATINQFLKNVGISQDQLQMNKAAQQNMYLLIGPSVSFGRTVEISAHAKGGLFINNGGLVNIQQRGAQRAAYRNEAADKSIYPGFITGVNVQYNTPSAWSFGLGLEYMSTKTEINNYDIRRSGGIEGLTLSRNIRDMVAAITIRYSIPSARETGSGQASGRRSRVNGSGLAAGRRQYQPLLTEPIPESCGPVTQRITYADGTTEELTFSCPEDAANYNNRMRAEGAMPDRVSMNTTTDPDNGGTAGGQKSQDHHSSRSNKTSGVAVDDTSSNNGSPTLRAQNNNTVKSNRTDNAIVVNDKESNTETTRSYIKNMFATLDELEQLLNNDQTNTKAMINTSRSHIKNQRAALNELEAALVGGSVFLSELEQKSNAEEKTFSQLLAFLKNLGSQYSSISNVLKTKHETAKNSISNIR